MDIYDKPDLSEFLAHYGVLGMKWGVRRYQSPNGKLTPLGKKRYISQVNSMKELLSTNGYKEQADEHLQNANRLKKQGYKKFAEDNDLNEYSEKDQKKFEDEIAKELSYANSSKYWYQQSKVLNQKLDSIDPTSMNYKEAMKMVKQVANEWVNDTLANDPILERRTLIYKIY